MTNLIWYGDKVFKEIKEKLKDPIKKSCLSIERSAKTMCPVDTGRLRASITTNWSWSGITRTGVKKPAQSDDGIGKPEANENELIGVTGTNVRYGPYVELGTSKMEAQSYLRPALEMNIEKIKKYFENIIK